MRDIGYLFNTPFSHKILKRFRHKIWYIVIDQCHGNAMSRKISLQLSNYSGRFLIFIQINLPEIAEIINSNQIAFPSSSKQSTPTLFHGLSGTPWLINVSFDSEISYLRHVTHWDIICLISVVIPGQNKYSRANIQFHPDETDVCLFSFRLSC